MTANVPNSPTDVLTPDPDEAPEPRVSTATSTPLADAPAIAITITTEPTRRQAWTRRLVLLALICSVPAGALLLVRIGNTSDSAGATPTTALVTDRGAATPPSRDAEANADQTAVTAPPERAAPAPAPAPEAEHDRFTVRASAGILDVLANDRIAEDVELSIVESPANATVEVTDDDRIRVVPSGVGDVVFTYEICRLDLCSQATAAAAVVPAGTSRFVPQPPTRVIDTRNGETPGPDAQWTVPLDGEPTATAVSVSIIGATQAGEVVVDGGAGAVTAVRSTGPGATTTNTVFVASPSGEVVVTSTAGAHLVVDIVGSFVPSEATTTGRFVSSGTVNIGRLVTAEEGRTAVFSIDPAIGGSGATAVLAVVTADVGADGGVIGLGPSLDDLGQMLMWGPPTTDDDVRQGLVLLTPSDANEVALRYDGGSVLDMDVVGYFTDESAEPTYTGLFVPIEPTTLFEGTIAQGDATEVTAPAGYAEELFVVRRSGATARSAVIDVVEGRVVLGGSGDDLRIEMLGAFT